MCSCDETSRFQVLVASDSLTSRDVNFTAKFMREWADGRTHVLGLGGCIRDPSRLKDIYLPKMLVMDNRLNLFTRAFVTMS